MSSDSWVGSLPRTRQVSCDFINGKLMTRPEGGSSHGTFAAAARRGLALLAQQQLTVAADGGLRCGRETLQQPGQHHLEPHVIVGEIDLPARELPERTNPQEHAVAIPALLIDLQHRQTCRRAPQPTLESTRGLLAAELTFGDALDVGCCEGRVSLVGASADLAPEQRSVWHFCQLLWEQAGS